MLWVASKARGVRSARVKVLVPLALVGGLVAIAAQGYRSALDRMSNTTLFVSAARVATGDVPASAVTAGETSRTANRRRHDRLLDVADAEAMSRDELLALSRVSENDDTATAAHAIEATPRTTSRARKTAHQSTHHRDHHTLKAARYTTVCVRLCDGSFFPISYATTASRFGDDAAACSARCGSPARLYVHRTGDSPEAMKDLAGNPYLKLTTAFAYRYGVSSQCTCHAQPWDEASVDRHRRYELEREALKGDAAARRELDLRNAVADVRGASIGVLAKLGTTQADDDLDAPAPAAFVFGPPVVAPLDEGSIRPPPPPRYAGELRPVSVVLDATGSPVRRLAAKSDKAPVHVSMLSRVTNDVVVTASLARADAVLGGAEDAERLLAAAPVVSADDAEGGSRAERARQTAGSARDAATSAHGAATHSHDENGKSANSGVSEQEEPRGAGRKQRPARVAQAARSKRRAVAHGEEPVRKARDRRQQVAAAYESSSRSEYVARADLKPDWREVIFRPY